MRWKSVFWTILGVILLLGLIWIVKFFWLRPVNIQDFFERIAYEQAALDPAYFVHLPPNRRDHFSRYRVEFEEFSPAFYENRAALSASQRSNLNEYPLNYLNESEKISFAGINHKLSQYAEASSFGYHHHLIHSFFFREDPIFFLLFEQPITNTDEAKAHIMRMRALGKVYNQLIAGLKDCETQNLYPPRSLVEAKMRQLKELINVSPIKHPLYLQYAEQLVRISRMQVTQLEKVDYLKSVEERIEKDVIPACKLLLAYLETMLPKTAENYSDAFFADSNAFYQHVLEGYLGRGYRTDSLHHLGLEYIEIHRIELQKLKDSLGSYPSYENSKNIFMNDSISQLKIDQFKASLEETAYKWEGILGSEIPSSPDIKPFPNLPMGLITFYSTQGFVENKTPGLFLNIHTNRSFYPNDIFTLTVPGKHYLVQTHLKEDLSLFTRLMLKTALQNGWELYAQKLAGEYGFYGADDNSMIYFHYQKNEYLYAALLVIDTGIFSKSWTLKQAVSYLTEQMYLDENTAQQWVYRVLAQPGKYSSYWIGYQKILELRNKAQKKQTLNFNIANFHQWLMRHQTVPLSEIEMFFEEYLGD